MRKNTTKALRMSRAASKAESTLFQKVMISKSAPREIGFIRLRHDLELTLTTDADPGWVAALVNALEATR
jgi:hypothetical protein